MTPEERERIEAVANVAENAQFALLDGLRDLGDLIGWAAAEEIAEVNSLASCGFLISELAGMVDGFRLLEADLNFRLRLAKQAAAPAPKTGRARGLPKRKA